jgi:hypothetical protein
MAENPATGAVLAQVCDYGAAQVGESGVKQ